MSYKAEMPQAFEAEQALLGSAMADEGVVSLACSTLQTSDFVDQRNRLVFESILRLSKAKKAVDPTTITEDLKTNRTLEDVGGVDYLFELARSYVSVDNAVFYCELVRDNSNLKNYILTLDGILKKYATGEIESPASFIAETKPAIDEAASKGTGDFQDMAAVVDEAAEEMSKKKESGGSSLTGMDTGFDKLNAITHGLNPGDLIILAGRPSMGKTTLAGNLAMNAAKTGKSVAFVELEMRSVEIVNRMIASVSNIAGEYINTSALAEAEWFTVESAEKKLKGLKVFFTDKSTGLLGDIVSNVTRQKNSHPDLGLVIIDSISQIRTGAKSENRQNEVATITRTLKQLARTLKCPVVALCHINRDSENNANCVPSLSNLRESGAIEQDADLVILLHRDSYYEAQKNGTEEPDMTTTQCIVAKNRNGRVGTISLDFYKKYSRFQDSRFEPRAKGEKAKLLTPED